MAAAWFDEALAVVAEVARQVVAGCHRASVEVFSEQEGQGYFVNCLHPWPAEAGAEIVGADTLRLVLSSEPSGDPLGVLSLSTSGGRFGPEAAEPAQMIARLAAAVVAGRHASLTCQAHLREAIRNRDVIGQAKGVIMAQSRVDADTAFGMLVRASQRENRKLREVAAELADRAGRAAERSISA